MKIIVHYSLRYYYYFYAEISANSYKLVINPIEKISDKATFNPYWKFFFEENYVTGVYEYYIS